MTLTRTTQRTLILCYFAIVAVVYAVAWWAPSIGLQHDDGVYLVVAKAIASGHGYAVESLPVPVLQTKFPPVFPLLLSLFVMISDQTPWLKALPLACTVAWLFVTYQLLRKMGAERYAALLLIALTAASPAVVFAGTNLLSESAFALLAAAALLALLDDRILLGGVMAGLATLTRAVGLPVIAACALTLVIRGRLRRAAIFMAAATFVIAPWFGWSLAHVSRVHSASEAYYGFSHYLASNIFTSLPASEKAAVAATNAMQLFFGPFEQLTGINDMYAAIFTFLLLAWCLWTRRQLMPDLFLLLYCGMLVAWAGPPQRLLTPVLPLILWLFWRAFRHVRIREAVAAGVLIAALLPLGASLWRISGTLRLGEFSATDRQPDDWRELNKLFAWIRQNTPPTAILCANLDPMFYLNTGRKAVRGYAPDGYKTFYQAHGQSLSADELSEELARSGVGWVALSPDRDFAESAAFHKSVEALARGGVLEPVAIPGLSPEYRLFQTASGRLAK